MRRIAISTVAALLALSALAPAASADEWPPPGFVAPCFPDGEWNAVAGEQIHFVCGWGTAGGPGKLVSYLNSYDATLVVRDGQGTEVLRLDPADIAARWGEPGVFPADDDFVDCAGPTGRAVAWHYWLDDGLPAGVYEVTLGETFRHPVNDGYHTCWLREDGSRIAPPPSLYGGAWEDFGTLTVVP